MPQLCCMSSEILSLPWFSKELQWIIEEQLNDMHQDSNMEGVHSNVYGHSNGPMMRARAKQLQSALIC